MKRERMLTPGNSGSIRWSRGGNETASIGYRVELEGLRLNYRTRIAGNDWRNVNELIPFEWTDTNFNGRRQWFVCLKCRGRCRVLFGGSFYRCRKCYQLKYESQYEPSYARATTQRHNIRKRLGQAGSLDDPFPPKPKGMHWKTYWRLESLDEQLEQRWVAGIAEWLERR